MPDVMPDVPDIIVEQVLLCGQPIVRARATVGRIEYGCEIPIRPDGPDAEELARLACAQVERLITGCSQS